MKYLYIAFLAFNYAYGQDLVKVVAMSEMNIDSALVFIDPESGRTDTLEYFILYNDYCYSYQEETNLVFFFGIILIECGGGYSKYHCKFKYYDLDNIENNMPYREFILETKRFEYYDFIFDEMGLIIILNNHIIRSIAYKELMSSPILSFPK